MLLFPEEHNSLEVARILGIALVFFLLSVIAFWVGVVGLIKPGLVVRWGAKRTRSAVLLYYGIPWLIFFVIWIFSLPQSSVSSGDKPQAQANASASSSTSSQPSVSTSNVMPGDIQAGDETVVNAKDGGFMALTKSDYNEWWNDITADNTTDMQDMLNKGSVWNLDNGTHVYIKSLSWDGTAFVRIDHLGVFSGQTGYIASDELTKTNSN